MKSEFNTTFLGNTTKTLSFVAHPIRIPILVMLKKKSDECNCDL